MRRDNIEYCEAENLASGVTKSRIDAYASNVAKIVKYKPKSDLIDLIDKLGGRVHYRSDFDWVNESGSVIVHGPEDFDIFLSNYTSALRDKFTLAHELGHYLLHSNFGKKPIVANRKGSDRAEWEANWFAAGFLMPQNKVKELVTDKGYDESRIASYFGVSPSAARTRLKALGLSNA